MKARARYSILSILSVATLIFLFACSKKKELPTEVIFSVHPAAWMEKSSDDYHGKKVAAVGLGSCKECHGADSKGGESKVSCFDCHGGGPGGHPVDWMDKSADKYHGKEIAQNGWAQCGVCHGADYKGGTSKKSCYACHDGVSGHPVGFDKGTSENFHGKKVAAEGIVGCTACHGADYKGGISRVSCYVCHEGGPGAHPMGWLDQSSQDYHGLAVITEGWESCADCHGADYTGGTSQKSCYACHNGPGGHPNDYADDDSDKSHGTDVASGGLEACAVCHGDDYQGGKSGVSCYTCHAGGPSGHPNGWTDASSDNYHGKKVLDDGWAACATCHGEDYKGGISGSSCYACHLGPGGHPNGYSDDDSENFHGEDVEESGIAACATCHGEDFKGGISGTSCYTCHLGAGGHPSDYADDDSENFHGEEVEDSGITACAVCHGDDYRGGTSGVSCYSCHGGGPGGHPDGWLSESSDNYHGKVLVEEGWEDCQDCHGDDYRGGTSGGSCYTCHNGPSGHPNNWMSYASDDFHGAAIREAGWDMGSCKVCHGDDYAGGISESSCLTCHSGTPEACNTCHGSSTNAAPPQDTQGRTETSFASVGAHQAHLLEGSLTGAVACSECHVVPATLHDAGHVDSDLPAEVIFGDFTTDSGSLTPAWDGSVCSNTYCHGAFNHGNPDQTPDWASVGEAACGTCHNLPPASPHPNNENCSLCHGNVVDADNNIIDKSKHINGSTDF